MPPHHLSILVAGDTPIHSGILTHRRRIGVERRPVKIPIIGTVIFDGRVGMYQQSDDYGSEGCMGSCGSHGSSYGVVITTASARRRSRVIRLCFSESEVAVLDDGRL
jgi:hypothetical protein